MKTKNKAISMLCALLPLAMMLSACGDGTSSAVSSPAEEQDAPSVPVEYSWDFAKANADIDELKQPCDQQGSVVTLEYDTPAYAVNDLLGVEETLHKTLNIYLPYGYDASQQYNVLYLLHGTKGETDGPMEEFWLKQWGEYTCPVLDNMIKNGLCEPVIVVCPNYYSEVEGCDLGDEQAKALADKLNDSYIYASEAEDGGELDNPQNIWPCYFGQELRSNIIPAVESAYSSYASGDVSEANLIATRDHRAFAGLSRGSMTVARAGLMENTDIISYFGTFSGIWTEFEQFKTTLENYKDYPVNFWYNGNGRGDFSLEDHRAFKDQVLLEMDETFVDGENFAWVSLKDGAHMYNSWIADLYNSLLVFFK